MRNIPLVSVVALLGMIAFAPKSVAYPTYSQGKVVNPAGEEEAYGNCKTCHGGFRDQEYIALTDGVTWDEVYQEVTATEPEEERGLHDIHRHVMVDKLSRSRCNVCHLSSGRYPVILNSSATTDLQPLSCMGCHGRTEDHVAQGSPSLSGRGAGLRQHHTNAGVKECMTCHADANPENYTPVAESVPPPYYFTPDAEFPNKPTNPCNQAGEEDYAGGWEGLDNDGDGIYDIFDSDCSPLAMSKICHRTAKGEQTIVVSGSNLPGHLGHGDTLGACPQVMNSASR